MVLTVIFTSLRSVLINDRFMYISLKFTLAFSFVYGAVAFKSHSITYLIWNCAFYSSVMNTVFTMGFSIPHRFMFVPFLLSVCWQFLKKIVNKHLIKVFRVEFITFPCI